LSARLPFWSDDFDADLLRIFPEVEQEAAGIAGVKLYTHAYSSFGRLNHPTVWNDHHGMIAFFTFTAGGPTLGSYYTRDPIVECTPLEVLRDVWSHDYIIDLEGRRVCTWGWWEVMQPLMYAVRGRPLPRVDLDKARKLAKAKVSRLLHAIEDAAAARGLIKHEESDHAGHEEA